MKIYIITDVEGVAGVTNWRQFGRPEFIHYGLCQELTTLEINAACEGFFAAGAKEVVVDDAHGRGGINLKLLDPRVQYVRGIPPGHMHTRMMDGSYDALAFVGQHPKAGTEHAHIAHTMDWGVVDASINGVSVGEFGMRALCASEMGVRTIFLSGDRAACQEARELYPGIETAEVKRGLMPGTGDEVGPEAYSARNEAAVHLHPQRAREVIRRSAEAAVRRMAAESFGIVRLPAPYTYVCRYRATGERPAREERKTHPTSVIELLKKA
ncbi:MAG: M55 family metallopeptidase [Armatimonadetes bacterium]|nr:M55 family metallopeptidase [Armatimonadota bacterium]